MTFANVGVVLAIFLALGGGNYVEAASSSLAKQVKKALNLLAALDAQHDAVENNLAQQISATSRDRLDRLRRR